jgi:hypothetical protein
MVTKQRIAHQLDELRRLGVPLPLLHPIIEWLDTSSPGHVYSTAPSTGGGFSCTYCGRPFSLTDTSPSPGDRTH